MDRQSQKKNDIVVEDHESDLSHLSGIVVLGAITETPQSLQFITPNAAPFMILGSRCDHQTSLGEGGITTGYSKAPRIREQKDYVSRPVRGH